MKAFRAQTGVGSSVCDNKVSSPGRRSNKTALSGRQELAFTMVEVLLVVAIIGVLMAIGLPMYKQMEIAGNSAIAKGDIVEIARDLDDFFFEFSRYPDTLDDIGQGAKTDPWGNPYRYTPISFNASKGKVKPNEKVRKDKNLHPINTDFDLYSMGPDGQSVAPLTAGPSQDDIIRASNGSFIGVAADY